MTAFAQTYQLPLEKFDLAVAVPLHPVRFRERGYNQSSLLVEEISRAFRIPGSTDNLIRIRHTQNQARIATKNRWTNIHDAFRIKAPSEFEKKSILLVDDLLTTGTTASEAARVLKQAGAQRVQVFTLALAV